MKRLLALFCLILMLPPIAVADETEAKELPIYQATAASVFYLRAEIDSKENVAYVGENYRVDIYEISGDWCRAVVRGQEGWCKLRNLNILRSLNIQKEPQYEAITAQKFTLWLEPNSTRALRQVPYDKFMTVYEYGEDWCQILYDGVLGWCKTKLLWGFRSLNAANYPVPGVQPNMGMLTLTQDTWIESKDFDGMNALTGSLICVRSQNEQGYTLPVWRNEDTIPLESGDLAAFVPWEEAKPGDLIAGFTTFYDEDYGEELAQARAFNIDLACQRIHDVVLQPGDRFSYNDLCAPYKKSNGYQLAPNISAKGTGYGGGVCQLTTTLYNALIPLPLQIDEWRVHQKKGVVYIPQYFDAAVGSFYDLIFNNTLPYPIRIYAKPQMGAVTVLLYRVEEMPQ